MQNNDIVGFDIETTGLRPRKGAKIFTYVAGTLDDFSILRDGESPQFRGELNRLFLNASKAKVCHNFKFELNFLQAEQVPVPESTVWHDTIIMSQLLCNNAISHALDKVAERLCDDRKQISEWRRVDDEVDRIATLFGDGPGAKRFDRVPGELMREYQANDLIRTMLVFHVMYPEIKSSPLLLADYQNEIELVKTTLRLESYGIKISKQTIRRIVKRLQDDLDKIQERCFDLFGEFINLNSGDQVARVLYTLLKLPILSFTDKGKPSTDKEVLLALREKQPHEVLEMIIKQRSYTKGIAILNSYIEYADVADLIHPTIKTNHARTGRESSEEPNLQNVSKEEVLKNPYTVPARECFITRPGYVLLFADYAGIEMRLIVEAAQERELLELIRNNGDPHALAAMLLFGDRWEKADVKLKKVLRSAAKNASFAIAYGAGAWKVSETLNLSFEEAEPGVQRYRNRFPRIAHFTKDISRLVQEYGYVETPFGRKLHVDIDKPYTGANYLIQGMAAGILKRAQVRVDRYLRDEWNDQIRIVLPIHDEIVFSYPRKLLDKKEEVLREISRLMVDMPEIKIPLAVEWKISYTNWNNAKELIVC